ncbi:MAG TPA: glycosyltransferase [Candidatus Angelobacter sp.]|nr:glycosyltransferase [Candidatus Angelobacter sp.]
MLTAAGILSLLIWGYLLLARGQFWRIHPADSTDDANQVSAQVAVIIPARNEADVIGQAIGSLLHQRGSQSIHIYLVDDGSSDQTAQAARAAATSSGHPEMLTVITGNPLPAGWAGKLWAMHQGIEAARAGATPPEFFLLTDADILHAPHSLSTLLAIARSRSADMASFMVKLHCQTLAEKLLIPAFVFFFFKLYPPAWVADPRRSIAGAAGGCILIRAAALQSAGGIEAIRNAVIDDCALAARVKHNGGRLWLGVSASTRSIRPYGGFSEIGRMISRSAFNQLGHSAWLLLAALLGMAATYLLPPALVIFAWHRGPAPVALGVAAWLAMAISFIPVLRLYRLNPFWGLALPLMALFYMGATFHSAYKYWSGRGGEWKGRVQDPLGDQR